MNIYNLWYLANGTHNAEGAHQLLAETKNHIAETYAKSLGYNNRQLAEGILNMVEFDRRAREMVSAMSGNSSITAHKHASKEIDYVHRKYGQEIREAWQEPTPTDKEIAYELAEKDFLNELDQSMKALERQSAFMAYAGGKAR